MLEPKLFADWLQQEVFQPVIVVIGTPIVKYRVKESLGLTLAEFFLPFGGEYRRIPVTCNCLDKQVRLDNIHFRFVESDDSTQWSTPHAERMASWAVETNSPRTPLSEESGVPTPGPWYEHWRSSICNSLRWSEHEGLDQPTAALLVASSKEADPAFLYDQLLHPSNMPPLCAQNVLDPVPSRCVLLLHDVSDPESPPASELEAKLEQLKSRFPPHLCMVLSINCGVLAEGEMANPSVEALYKPVLLARGPEEGTDTQAALNEVKADVTIRTALTREDLDSLAQMCFDVIVKGAVPWMEAQLSILDGQITHARKGFRNQIKYLWRKPRESTSGGATSQTQSAATTGHAEKGQDSSVLYTLQTVEGQLRLAGDLAFHLRDYVTAVGYYRSVLGDFKQDKSLKHMAGACEMTGVCAYILGQGQGEFDRAMEQAYEYYMKAGATRHAMRAVTLHRAMVNDYKEMVQRLMKVSGDLSAENGLRNAMILEQAAHLYGLSGCHRKAAFHMVLAGHNFSKLGFKKLALRSYNFVCTNYVEKRWMHIIDHVHFTMARQAFGLGLLSESLWHFMSLVNSFNQNYKRKQIQADREATYLKEFLFVVKTRTERVGDTSSEEPTLNLHLPEISSDIMVVLQGDLAGVRGGHTSVAVPPPPPPPPPPPAVGGETEDKAPVPIAWVTMGEWLLSAMTADEKLELQWRDKHDERVFDTLQRVSPVGEEVYVDLKLTNPLRSKVDLTNARLYGTLTESLGTGDTTDQVASGELLPHALVFPAQAVSIAPSETKLVRFVAIAKRVGILRIEGVMWSFFDQVPCRRPLKCLGRRLRASLEQRSDKEGVYSVDTRLQVKVRARVPQVTACVEGWPDPGTPLLQGEQVECMLVVRGKEAQTASLATSHPAFVGFGTSIGSMPKLGNQRFPVGGVLRAIPLVASEDDPTCLARIPFTLRAESTGKHAIRIGLLIEADPKDGERPADRRQWVTIQERLNILPSFRCTISQAPSVAAENRYVLSCIFENKAQVPLEVQRVRGFMDDKEFDLKDCAAGTAQLARKAEPGQTLQLVFAYERGAGRPMEDSTSGTASTASKLQLLQASRAAASPGDAAPSHGDRTGFSSNNTKERVDLMVQWSSASSHGSTPSSHQGEVYVLRIPCERPSNTPCPLVAQVLAPEKAWLSPDAEVPVTVVVQNPLGAGDVSFYIVADTPPDFLWLGRERSEVVHLSGGGSHKMAVHAYFYAPGIYALNRFRLFIVGMTSGSVPVTEQAPLGFGFPHEQFIEIHAEQESAK